MTAAPAHTDRTPLAASILALLDGIKKRGPDAPAALAFRSAIKRKGADAYDSGGPAVVERLLHEIIAADPERAAAREAMVRPLWLGSTEKVR